MKKLLFLLLILIISQNAVLAQTKGMKPVGGDAPAGTERRIALVIGNRDYPFLTTLKNPLNDANDMETALKRLGFEVIKVTNTDFRTLTNTLNRFKEGLSSSDVAFFYYSGHGASYGGKNYLLPTDINADCLEQIEDQGVSLNRILGDIASKNVKNSFVVWDACRNIPKLKLCDNAKKDFATNGPVRPTNNPRGSMVVYATEEGTTADDNATGRNGLFTEALLRYLTLPNLTIKTILDKASLEVDTKSVGRQTPARYDKIYGDFYFVINKDNPVPEKPIVVPPTRVDLPVGPEMVYVRGGSFDMGSTEGEADEKPVHTVTVSSFSMAKYETTVAEFAEFVAETNYRTDAEKEGNSKLWNSMTNKVYDSTGIHWRHGADGVRLLVANYHHPVVHVSHNDAVAYCAWLSKKTGRTYRLPTEAEWEYAAGNGLKHSKYSWGDSETAGVTGNVADQSYKSAFDGKFNYNSFTGYTDGYAYTAPVGKFKTNEFGLYDMTGNVFEWCADWYGADYYANSSSSNPTGPATGASRVLRGGSWTGTPAFSRVAYRNLNTPSSRDFSVGFRVVSLQ
ncbi:MAG: SUMF1/EgtB/PvdO family nonheme iron enzyme [Spirosomataceae bacterium]